MKHEIEDLVRRGAMKKAEYLEIAWEYRKRHPKISKAQCLQDFMKLVGQPIVGWNDETAAATFKRYYSETKQGYVPTDHKDHGYTPMQDLEFIVGYLEEEWPDPDGSGR